MHVDNLLHGFPFWEADVVEETTTQERIGQFLFIVRSDHHDGTVLGDNRFLCLVDKELHAV